MTGELRPTPFGKQRMSDAERVLRRSMVREARRKVDMNGIVRWGGAEYQLPISGATLHGRAVIARQTADGTDRLIVEDAITGVRAVALPRRRSRGEKEAS